MTDCVFCTKMDDVLADDGLEWNRQGNICWFRPLNPVVPGHFLFVPYAHVEDAGENPAVTGAVFAEAARFGEKYRHWYGDFNLITSAGTDATQTVFHLHVHYVPRKPNDGLHLPWTGQVK